MSLIKNKYDLGFISDENIYDHVRKTVLDYRLTINFAEFKSNLIDPIKLSFDAKVYKMSIKDLVEQEVVRQIDKSNSNQIGYFHQNIFRYFDEWEVPKEGFDVINKKLNFYAEIKNKHNTMNAASAKSTYIKMQNTILKNPKATTFLVEVISKRSQNIPWETTIEKVKVCDSRVRKVSMDKFYEIVTGDKFSFKKLCEKLPIIIDDVVNNEKPVKASNEVFDNLNKLDQHLLKSIYLLTFEKYEGFKNGLNIQQ